MLRAGEDADRLLPARSVPGCRIQVKRYRRETAASNDYAPFRKYFKRDMHGSMVANLARLGLLTDRVRPRLEKLGVSLPAS